MATAVQARQQLSRDMRDYFASTTTTTAAAADKLDDARLTDEDDDIFVTRQATVWIAGGQTGGPTSDEERAISSKASNIITAKRNFSVTLADGVNYEVHRKFSAADKDEAITVALDLMVPRLWKEKIVDITTVADQFDYDISAHGFYNNQPNEVSIVSDGDTEVDFPLFAWEIRDGDTLHFLQRIAGDKTVRLRGIIIPTLADIIQPQLQILSSRAAMYIYEGIIAEATNDQVTRWERALTMEGRRLEERIRRHQKPAPPSTIKNQSFDHTIMDFNFFAA